MADLSPRVGTEPGKPRPVLVVQSDLLNAVGHPSTSVLPCTTRMVGGEPAARAAAGRNRRNPRDCEIMIDQSRAIDNRRFRQRLRAVPSPLLAEVKDKLRQLADLE